MLGGMHTTHHAATGLTLGNESRRHAVHCVFLSVLTTISTALRLSWA
jgi:hypothetical protein